MTGDMGITGYVHGETNDSDDDDLQVETNDVHFYDPANDTWRSAHRASKRRFILTAFVHDDELYAIVRGDCHREPGSSLAAPSPTIEIERYDNESQTFSLVG